MTSQSISSVLTSQWQHMNLVSCIFYMFYFLWMATPWAKCKKKLFPLHVVWETRIASGLKDQFVISHSGSAFIPNKTKKLELIARRHEASLVYTHAWNELNLYSMFFTSAIFAIHFQQIFSQSKNVLISDWNSKSDGYPVIMWMRASPGASESECKWWGVAWATCHRWYNIT